MGRGACRSSWNVLILKTDRSGMASVAFVVDLANAYEKVQLVAVWRCTFFFAFSAWESRRFSFIFPRAYVDHGRLVLALNWLVLFLEIFMQDVMQEFSRFALGKEEVFALVTLECIWWF